MLPQLHVGTPYVHVEALRAALKRVVCPSYYRMVWQSQRTLSVQQSAIQKYCISMALEHCLFTVSFAWTTAVVLSQ